MSTCQLHLVLGVCTSSDCRICAVLDMRQGISAQLPPANNAIVHWQTAESLGSCLQNSASSTAQQTPPKPMGQAHPKHSPEATAMLMLSTATLAGLPSIFGNTLRRSRNTIGCSSPGCVTYAAFRSRTASSDSAPWSDGSALQLRACCSPLLALLISFATRDLHKTQRVPVDSSHRSHSLCTLYRATRAPYCTVA